MKAKDVSVNWMMKDYTWPRFPEAPCRWDIGVTAAIKGNRIPLFTIEKNVVSDKVYPMLFQEGGSVEVHVPEGRVIVYHCPASPSPPKGIYNCAASDIIIIEVT